MGPKFGHVWALLFNAKQHKRQHASTSERQLEGQLVGVRGPILPDKGQVVRMAVHPQRWSLPGPKALNGVEE